MPDARRLNKTILGFAVGSAALVAAGACWSGGRPHIAWLIVAVVATCAGLSLEVDLPWGGRVPLGYAVVIAVGVLVSPVEAVAVTGVALVAGAAWGRSLRSTLAVAVGVAVASAARAVDLAVIGPPSSDLGLLGQVAVVGTAFLAIDLLAGRRRLRQVGSLYVTILCAGALLAIAFDHEPALSLVAVVPLVVTKYSFGRLTDARSTYSQTTQALSLLPEVAGLTPLGHGERTAVYAARWPRPSGSTLPASTGSPPRPDSTTWATYPSTRPANETGRPIGPTWPR